VALHDFRKFLGEFVSDPTRVGAVAPSSSRLARGMVGTVAWDTTAAIVEYGPGTGSMTREIVAQMPPGTSYLAIEINPRFAALLEERFPGVRVCQGSVADVKTHCQTHGLESVDAIVSGLPWASFSDRDQTSFLDATMHVLRTGGQFITFAYLQGLPMPAGRRFRRKLKDYFSEVRMSRPVWANLPPAVFYCCRR